jgi:predicted AAA+ superfamily ATPase
MTSFRPRHLELHLSEFLSSFPVTYVNGPRQAGKSTMCQNYIHQIGVPASSYMTLDDSTLLAAAQQTPQAFITGQQNGLRVVDEVQRAPEVFRALKVFVDDLRRKKGGEANGLFLLTGSANVMALPGLADALVGRMAIATLYPFSLSEALGGRGEFVINLLQGKVSPPSVLPVFDITAAIQYATFPSISGKSPKDQNHFFSHGYIRTLVERELRELAEIERLPALQALLHLLAQYIGQPINITDLARRLNLQRPTLTRYLSLLDAVFVRLTVPAWHRKIRRAGTKAPKAYLIDTCMAASLLGRSLEDLLSHDNPMRGPVVENWVATELTKLISHHLIPARLYHYRPRTGRGEVDFIIQHDNGQIAAVEVKAGEHVSTEDFQGLKELQKETGADFMGGVVLYGGNQIVSFGRNLWAVPLIHLSA